MLLLCIQIYETHFSLLFYASLIFAKLIGKGISATVQVKLCNSDDTLDS